MQPISLLSLLFSTFLFADASSAVGYNYTTTITIPQSYTTVRYAIWPTLTTACAYCTFSVTLPYLLSSTQVPYSTVIYPSDSSQGYTMPVEISEILTYDPLTVSVYGCGAQPTVIVPLITSFTTEFNITITAPSTTTTTATTGPPITTDFPTSIPTVVPTNGNCITKSVLIDCLRGCKGYTWDPQTSCTDLECLTFCVNRQHCIRDDYLLYCQQLNSINNCDVDCSPASVTNPPYFIFTLFLILTTLVWVQTAK